MADNLLQYYGTGRRKTSTARVFLRPGTGAFQVNGRTFDQYFPNETLKMLIRQPLAVTETTDKFDLVVRVDGGGVTGQVVQRDVSAGAREQLDGRETDARTAAGHKHPLTT